MCGKILLSLLLLALSQVLSAQEFTPIYENLDRLESLMSESQALIESTQKDNESLETALQNLDELLKTQGALLAEQQRAWEEQQAISRRQSELLGKYVHKSKVLTVSLTVGIPLAVGAGILTGMLISR
jgi:hypothetical protein